MKHSVKIDFAKKGKVRAGFRLYSVISRAVIETLVHENICVPARVSVTLCDNPYIHGLNMQYREIDRPTDVLSFPMYEKSEIDFYFADEQITLGDIVISLDAARVQAEELGHSFLREIAFLTVHSMLHLLGYDHERSPEDDEEQCRIQKEIVEALKIK